jgi:hypothetical protein
MREPWFWGDRVNKESVFPLLRYSLLSFSSLSSPFFLSFSLFGRTQCYLSKQKPGTYLVRCGSQPGRFVVNFVSKKGKNLALEGIELFPFLVGRSLIDLVKEVAKQFKLKVVLTGRTLAFSEKKSTYLGDR